MTSAVTVEGAIEIAKTIQERAKGHLENEGFVTPLVFLFLRKDIATGESFLEPHVVVTMPESLANHEEKDAYAKFLFGAVRAGNAVAVISLMEVWSTEGSEDEVFAWRAEHDSLEFYPGRKEKVSLVLEHQDLHGGVMWLAEIHRDGDKASLGPWVVQDTVSMEGRFYGFFNEPVMA